MGSEMCIRDSPDPDQQELRDLLIDRYSQNDAHAYLAMLDALAVWSVVSRLGDLHIPTLFITAEHDYTSVQDNSGTWINFPTHAWL